MKNGANKMAIMIDWPQRFTRSRYQIRANMIRDMERLTVTVYGRTGCHLCEDAIKVLNEYELAGNYEIKEILIDGNRELESEYGQLIPVIKVNGKYFSHFRVDLSEFKVFLEKHRQHQ